MFREGFELYIPLMYSHATKLNSVKDMSTISSKNRLCEKLFYADDKAGSSYECEEADPWNSSVFYPLNLSGRVENSLQSSLPTFWIKRAFVHIRMPTARDDMIKQRIRSM